MSTPAPDPVPGPADRALAQSLVPWVYGHHVGATRDVAAAAYVWLCAKGLIRP